MTSALLILFYLLAPAAIIWLTERSKILNGIGAIIVLYTLGIIVGNIGIIPAGAHTLQELISSILVPLAIPMMLFSCDFTKFSWRSSLLTLGCGVAAVVVTVVGGYLVLKPHLGAEGARIAGMLSGVYTGGTPNLAALKLALGVTNDTYLLVNSFDIIVSFVYLLFLMTVGIRFFRRILPFKSPQTVNGGEAIVTLQHPYRGIFKWRELSQVLTALGISIAIVGVSAGLGSLVEESAFMMVTILGLTTLGIGAAFVKPIRRLRHSYDVGLYLIYAFCLVVASMVNIGELDFPGGLWIGLYIVIAVFGSLILAVGLSRLFRIDADTTVIASVALINSPPMVPMITTAMKNRNVLVTGLGIGIVGYAIGNYLGVVICRILS